MALLAIYFGTPSIDAPSGDRRAARFPFISRVVAPEGIAEHSSPETHGTIRIVATRSVIDPWKLSDADLVQTLFSFACDYTETLARHQGKHLRGEYEYILSPHEYSGPPPVANGRPESTILQVELDNPLRLLAP